MKTKYIFLISPIINIFPFIEALIINSEYFLFIKTLFQVSYSIDASIIKIILLYLKCMVNQYIINLYYSYFIFI